MSRRTKRPARAVILVGHGAVPTDCPRSLVAGLKRLQASSRGRPAPGLLAAENKIRGWPRTPETDPYQAGLESLAADLRRRLPGRLVLTAYNEFCAPSLADAVDALVADGVRTITVIPTMLTPGGSHSEIDIPEALAALRARHPQAELHYAWPVDVELLAAMLADHLQRASGGAPL